MGLLKEFQRHALLAVAWRWHGLAPEIVAAPCPSGAVAWQQMPSSREERPAAKAMGTLCFVDCLLVSARGGGVVHDGRLLIKAGMMPNSVYE